MEKRYAFFLFLDKKAEIPRILEQNFKNSPKLGAKRQKFPICWGKKDRNSFYFGAKLRNSNYFGAKFQKFPLFWGKIAEISLI